STMLTVEHLREWAHASVASVVPETNLVIIEVLLGVIVLLLLKQHRPDARSLPVQPNCVSDQPNLPAALPTALPTDNVRFVFPSDVPQLNEYNFTDFKRRMELILEEEGWLVAVQSPGLPDEDIRNRKAYFKILDGVPEQHQRGLNQTSNAY